MKPDYIITHSFRRRASYSPPVAFGSNTYDVTISDCDIKYSNNSLEKGAISFSAGFSGGVGATIQNVTIDAEGGRGLYFAELLDISKIVANNLRITSTGFAVYIDGLPMSQTLTFDNIVINAGIGFRVTNANVVVNNSRINTYALNGGVGLLLNNRASFKLNNSSVDSGYAAFLDYPPATVLINNSTIKGLIVTNDLTTNVVKIGSSIVDNGLTVHPGIIKVTNCIDANFDPIANGTY